jgi:prevent-host-death family protein
MEPVVKSSIASKSYHRQTNLTPAPKKVIMVKMTKDRRFTVAEAKARFAECLRDAEEGRPVVISRHGKPVAVVVSVSDFEQVKRLRAAGPESGLASLAGGWKGSDELVELVQNVRRTPGRRGPKLSR